MAIKLTDKIHIVSTDIDTKNRGSAQANAGRDAYTLQEVSTLIGGGGGGGTIGGSITDGQIAFGAATPNEIAGSNDFKIVSGDLVINFPTVSIRSFNIDRIRSLPAGSVELYSSGFKKLETYGSADGGVKVTGQMDLAALNVKPSSASDTGTLGEIRWALDGSDAYVYLCTAANTWVRAPLVTF